MDKLNRERQLEQFELSKQAIEVSQKKLDTVRSYAKETYGIGKSAFDQVYKDQFDAAKEIVKDESAARQLAQQNTLKMLELKQQADLRREEMRSQEKIAGMRGATSATLTPNQRAEIANKAIDNINATLKANVPLQMRAAKDPAYMQQLVQAETARLMAAAEGRTIPTAPGAGSPGGTSLKYNPATGKIE
jgi:leucyl aminopeptidase (aminopeptidase T)